VTCIFSINGKHPIRLAWEFEVDDEIYDGSLSSMHHLELAEFSDIGEVVVLHDPQRPQINTLYVV
jgi:hypothetical protein